MAIGLYAQLACIWEASARKPGNVHRYRDFADMTYLDFLASAAAIAPVMARAPQQRVGQTILDAVTATRQVTSVNTNLGIILLFAPLAAVPEGTDLRQGVEEVLANLTVEDARLAYQAIRLADPGGLGQVDEQDVAEEPTLSLRAVMALAAAKDMIARQYVNGYQDVFRRHDDFTAVWQTSRTLEEAIIRCHLTWMAQFPDSLVFRKHGLLKAKEVQRLASRALVDDPKEVAPCDAWLRAEELNPGTSADLTAACLFVALRSGIIKLPLPYPWSRTPGE